MKTRRLPIPLILLIPIVLLAIVVVAGAYRFSLSDEEILAKFPSSQKQVAVEFDSVVQAVFDLKTTNPWTIQVPENNAYAFIDELNLDLGKASGGYDSGAERGTAVIDIHRLKKSRISDQLFFFAPMAISNQGSGVFYYLAQFKFDEQRSRIIMVDSLFLGDRVQVTDLSIQDENTGVLSYKKHSADQAMSEKPAQEVTRAFRFNKNSILSK